MPTHSFQATLTKKRATCAASEDGTPPGLRSSVSDISFMISDSLRPWSGMVGRLLSREDQTVRVSELRALDSLSLEILGQAFLQCRQRLGQCVGLVVLEDHSTVVQRSDHEAEHLLVAHLNMAIAAIYPFGDCW